jgi:hypothetical protein
MSKDPKKPHTDETSTEPKGKATEQYFFPGGGEYLPVSIEATSQEEALKKYEEIRVSTTPPAPLPLQDKDVVE